MWTTIWRTCYTLARCMMKRGMATNSVPDPPYSQEPNRIEGYFKSCDGPPGDNAGSRIPQREITSIKGNSKIDTDYVQYIHATMRIGMTNSTRFYVSYLTEFGSGGSLAIA
ncbi:hypothetical protein VP01_1389g2 [Puccinia sorghi]|uniref:Uncharacterized protein n=1 Tax=Puccinia sorghi TaxID=27349 RepID=A0A0L6VL70_9BASI|nr:hypothetical protein VP01_1389g2 [Puccinia sorghi]